MKYKLRAWKPMEEICWVFFWGLMQFLEVTHANWCRKFCSFTCAGDCFIASFVVFEWWMFNPILLHIRAAIITLQRAEMFPLTGISLASGSLPGLGTKLWPSWVWWRAVWRAMKVFLKLSLYMPNSKRGVQCYIAKWHRSLADSLWSSAIIELCAQERKE